MGDPVKDFDNESKYLYRSQTIYFTYKWFHLQALIYLKKKPTSTTANSGGKTGLLILLVAKKIFTDLQGY